MKKSNSALRTRRTHRGKMEVGVGSRSVFMGYGSFLSDVKQRIRTAQVKATLSANAELIHLYWDIGRVVATMQRKEGWGAGIIPRLARDLQNTMPEVKGFSERNIKRMLAFWREYPSLGSFVPQAAAQLPSSAKRPQVAAQLETGRLLSPSVAAIASPRIGPAPAARLSDENTFSMLQQFAFKIPWFHHVLLMEKVKDLPARLWYMRQTIEFGWSRNILFLQVAAEAHKRTGKAVHNFNRTLPQPQSDLAVQVLKDPYIFDFLTLAEPFREREMELALLNQVEKFLLELGQGFAFVGRQFHLDVGADDFYMDLLFYHLRLRCFVVVDLKKGAFKAEYAGKMNFYCNVVDDRLRHPDDKPTIGLILCQDKNKMVAEYALKGVNKAIGISAYQLTRALPREFRSSLPSVKEMETELTRLATRLKPKKSKQGK